MDILKHIEEIKSRLALDNRVIDRWEISPEILDALKLACNFESKNSNGRGNTLLGIPFTVAYDIYGVKAHHAPKLTGGYDNE